MIDLHIHTTASDGTDTPEEVIRKAKKAGLSAISITDHDTAAGAAEAMRLSIKYAIEVVPGIEISSEFEGEEVHILGYFIDPDSPKLQPVLDWVIKDRNTRNERIIRKLADDGYDISLEELKESYPGAVIGRPHIAGKLLEKGYVNSIQQAFDEFLTDGKPYFLPRTYLPVEEAVKVIRSAGGAAVVAHPLQYNFTQEKLYRFLKETKGMGVVGMETVYSKYSEEETKYLENIADEMMLIRTGGSDYHGTRKPDIEIGKGEGTMRVPDSYLADLKTVKKR